MSQLRAMVTAYTDEHERSDAWVARRMGVSSQTLSSWWTRGTKRLPTPGNLKALADAINVPYRYVLDAALHDAGYLPEPSGVDHSRHRGTFSEQLEADFLGRRRPPRKKPGK